MYTVLATVRYLSKAAFFSECGDLHGISRASVSRAIDNVTKSICNRLYNINFPTGNDAIRTKHEFYQIAGFPNVLGAVDGTLIPIIAPKDNEPEYVCRRGFHAMNVQVVADASLRFTNVVCKLPGSTHECVYVFKLRTENPYGNTARWIKTLSTELTVGFLETRHMHCEVT